MITDYAREIMSGVCGSNYIFIIFFWNLPTFPCLLPNFLELPVPTFSLLFAGKPVEALPTSKLSAPQNNYQELLYVLIFDC